MPTVIDGRSETIWLAAGRVLTVTPATGAGRVTYLNTDGDPAATGEAEAGIGSLYVDTTNGKLYINGGTKAEPLWKIVTSA